MSKGDRSKTGKDWKALLGADEGFMREVVREAVQEALEAEMTECLGAEKSSRSDGRKGYRSGYYKRDLVTRVGAIELRVPQDRQGLFSTEVFERYQRSEKALVDALIQMYVQGVSTRKVKEVTETLCGHSFSASSVSRMTCRLVKRSDATMNSMLRKLRKLGDDELYVISDAIDAEISRREELSDTADVSSRQRANERSQSYRRKNGAGGESALVLGVKRTVERKKQAANKPSKRRAA